MSKVFRPWKTDEVWLLPPSVADFVPAGHPAHLIRDLVSEELDLSAIMQACTEVKGYPPHHPAMMVALLLYAYRSDVYSSRRIARACEERLNFLEGFIKRMGRLVQQPTSSGADRAHPTRRSRSALLCYQQTEGYRGLTQTK